MKVSLSSNHAEYGDPQARKVLLNIGYERDSNLWVVHVSSCGGRTQVRMQDLVNGGYICHSSTCRM